MLERRVVGGGGLGGRFEGVTPDIMLKKDPDILVWC